MNYNSYKKIFSLALLFILISSLSQFGFVYKKLENIAIYRSPCCRRLRETDFYYSLPDVINRYQSLGEQSPEISIIFELLESKHPVLVLNGLRGLLRILASENANISPEEFKKSVLESVLHIAESFNVANEKGHWTVVATVAQTLAELNIRDERIENLLTGLYNKWSGYPAEHCRYLSKIIKSALVQLGYRDGEVYLFSLFNPPPVYIDLIGGAHFSMMSFTGIETPVSEKAARLGMPYAASIFNSLMHMINSNLPQRSNVGTEGTIYRSFNGKEEEILFNSKERQQLIGLLALAEFITYVNHTPELRKHYREEEFLHRLKNLPSDMNLKDTLLDILNSDSEDLRAAAAFAIGISGIFETLNVEDKLKVQKGIVYLMQVVWKINDNKNHRSVSYSLGTAFAYDRVMALLNQIIFASLCDEDSQGLEQIPGIVLPLENGEG